jgi:hypothetical protein
MQMPPENPVSERLIRCMIIQSRTHLEYCFFKRKALLLRMTLNHGFRGGLAAENKAIKRYQRHHLRIGVLEQIRTRFPYTQSFRLPLPPFVRRSLALPPSLVQKRKRRPGEQDRICGIPAISRDTISLSVTNRYI